MVGEDGGGRMVEEEGGGVKIVVLDGFNNFATETFL